jgi:hypothetical protein
MNVSPFPLPPALPPLSTPLPELSGATCRQQIIFSLPFTMPTRSKSVINGTTVDISHLAREIQADVAKYRQYKAEDGMKKRAIHACK